MSLEEKGKILVKKFSIISLIGISGTSFVLMIISLFSKTDFTEKIGVQFILGVYSFFGFVIIAIYYNSDNIVKMLNNMDREITYLSDQKSVNSELERLVKQAKNHILTCGSKSSNTKYLKILEEKCKVVDYKRILNGYKITDELKEHVHKLCELDKFRLYGIAQDSVNRKYLNFTVVDNDVLIVLPHPRAKCFTGLLLHNEGEHFVKYFNTIIEVNNEYDIKNLTELIVDKNAKDDNGVKWLDILGFVNNDAHQNIS